MWRTEHQRKTDVASREQQTLRYANLFIVPVQYAKVKRHQGGDYAKKEQPDPGRLAQKIGIGKGDSIFHECGLVLRRR